MPDQSGLDDDHNHAGAQRLVRVVEQFVETLHARGGDHAASVILDSGTTLDGQMIGQSPERFVEEELINPVLSALGHEIRFRPKGIAGLDDRVPDFASLQLDVTNVGEVKTPGEIGRANDETVTYLRSVPDRPLVGIATDGFTWRLYTAREGEPPSRSTQQRLYRLIRLFRQEQEFDGPRKRRRALREEALSVATAFSPGGINERLTE
jgi:hypothetical protein